MYKIFAIEEISILNGGRFTGDAESVRRSNDKTKFITQLRSGKIPNEGETFMTHTEALTLMSTVEWKSEEPQE